MKDDTLAEGLHALDADALKAGEKVSVNWQKSGSKKIADQVTPHQMTG